MNKISVLDDELESVSNALHAVMRDLLPQCENGGKECRLFEAMHYAALSPGKRLRPFLTVMCAGLFGVSQTAAFRTAAAIEFLHAYSLVHDDLPAMDDDDIRRGQPSCHIQFDEATAILTGDALLTHAFDVLAQEETHPDAKVRCDIISLLARAAGPYGMVGGQMMDMVSQKGELSLNEIIHLQHMKTGALFAMSCEIGAALGKATKQHRISLRAYGHALGLAFQITDDLLDIEGTSEQIGKSVGKDTGKATYISLMGAEKSRDQACMLIKQAVSHLDAFDERADILRELAEYLVTRKR